MLVYLSKKIAIPNGISLRCISWNGTKGYIACGGDDGLLKVLKLETQGGTDARLKGLAAPSNLCMNQSLEAHEGRVQVVAWNEHHVKLTSSDENGLIVVWSMYKGTWYEEMINNRNKSVVKHMSWNKDGKKICIVYEDGLVIVGSVEGSRIWAKELKMQLNFVQWSPDGRYLLFGNTKAEIHIYDNLGNHISKMAIYCLTSVTGAIQLAGLDWYCGKGHRDPNSPSLAVCFDNGRAQLMKYELDPVPIKIDTGIMVSCIKWNIDGKLLAFAGTQTSPQEKEYNVVQFYNPLGQHLHTLRIPGKTVSGITWELNSLRIALAVDSFIYFANIRHDYKWGYFSNTVVYAYFRPDKVDQTLLFWNTQTNERNYKSLKKLMFLETCHDYSLTVSQSEDKQFSLLLCNDLGTPVDSRHIDIEPHHACISHTHIAVATKNVIYTWHYRTSSRLASSEVAYTILRKGREGKETLLHVDETPLEEADYTIDRQKNDKKTVDPICCMCASDRSLVVGRVSGKLQLYSLPKMNMIGRVVINCRPHRIALNCDSTKLSVIDIVGVLGLLDLKKPSLAGGVDNQIGKQLPLERKDVWDLCWADDNPNMFTMMEKTRMYIFRGLDPEEPVVSSGHICSFSDLQVKSVLLDEIMKDPDNPSDEYVFEMEVKSLRDSRELLDKVGIQDASQFIEDNPHPRLWRLLAEAALEKLELEVAEKAFVHSRDYQGIQFVKRLKKLDSSKKQLAEVAAYFKRFEEAEKIYIEMDRRDLAVELRTKLGNDVLLAQAWNAIGDYYADRQKWQHAVTYYTQGCNQEKLAECYNRLENYEGLDKLLSSLPDGHPLLESIGKIFVNVGMCQQAVSALLKCSKVAEAIDVCVHLNEWDQAIELANQNNVGDVNNLLVKYANHLLEKNQKLTAIALYRKANRYIEAAKLLQQVAKEQTAHKASPLMMKKLYVLCGLLVESYRAQLKKKQQAQTSNNKPEVLSSLRGVLAEEANTLEDTQVIDNAWRGAEAYHFFLLAQRQLYEGNREASMRTDHARLILRIKTLAGKSLVNERSIHQCFPLPTFRATLALVDYDDILAPGNVHSLIALISALHQAFFQCSKAFVVLESLDSISDEKRTHLGELSLEIFSRHSPRDVVSNKINCSNCGAMINDWDVTCSQCGNRFPRCIASGRPLLDYHYWSCPTCKHRALESEITSYTNCPLCHFSIPM